MDPLDLLTLSAACVGAGVAKKVGDLLLNQAFETFKGLLEGKFGRDPDPDDVTAENLRAVQADASPEFRLQVDKVAARSSALRRPRFVKRVAEGARVLWVDDQPGAIAYGRGMGVALGATVGVSRPPRRRWPGSGRRLTM
jgi:hypothetical protein